MAHSDIFREGEELHFFDYYSEGSRGRHYRTMTPERIAALISQFGQPVTLQRMTGTTTQVPHDVVCQAVVRGYEPVQLIGGIIQGDRQVTITNAEIADAQWPGPPRNGDRCVIDGRTTTIQACDTRRLRNEIVLHLIQVRG